VKYFLICDLEKLLKTQLKALQGDFNSLMIAIFNLSKNILLPITKMHFSTLFNAQLGSAEKHPPELFAAFIKERFSVLAKTQKRLC